MARRVLRTLACVAAAATGAGALKPGDTLPDVSFDLGFPPDKVSLTSLCKGKRMVLVGLPGAFTTTWSTKQIPDYLAKQDELKKHGVDQVAIFAVNDAAVMGAWAKDQETDGSLITLYGDPRSEVTKALDLVLDHPGPMAVLGNPRCKRFSALVQDCRVKTVHVAESDDDPAGDAKPDVSMPDQMLADLKALKDEL